MHGGDVENETEYLKGQCLMWSFEKAQRKFKDIVLITKEGKAAVKKNTKHERVVMFEAEICSIHQSATGIFQDITSNLEAVKVGHKEEEVFWERMQFRARDKQKMFEEYWMQVSSLKNAFEEEFGSDFAKRRLCRTKQKNKTKNFRRQSLFKSKKERRLSPGIHALLQKSTIKCDKVQGTWKGDMFMDKCCVAMNK